MEECVDGDYQTFKAKDGAYLREDFFGKYPELLELVKDYPRRAVGASSIAAATIPPKSTTPTSAPSNTRAAPRSSSPKPSKVTALARRRLAMRPILRRSWLTMRSRPSSSASTSPSLSRQQKTEPSTAPPPTRPRSPTCSSAARSLAAISPPARSRARLQSSRPRLLQGVDSRLEQARRVDHDGLRQSCCKHLLKDPIDRQTRRADRAR